MTRRLDKQERRISRLPWIAVLGIAATLVAMLIALIVTAVQPLNGLQKDVGELQSQPAQVSGVEQQLTQMRSDNEHLRLQLQELQDRVDSLPLSSAGRP